MEKLPLIKLRALEPEDLDLLYQIENDQELWDVGTTNVPYSRFMLHEYIASVTGDIFADRQVRWVIENEDNEIVGLIDLINFNPQHNRAEVGLVIQKQFRDQGYGHAALLQLIDYSHKFPHIHQLYALVNGNNVKCANVFKKVGFQQDAVLTDWLFDGEQYHDVLLLRFFYKKHA